MRVLCIGDVCGSIGCKYATRVLPSFRRQENIDMTVINGENSADGNGITPESAEMLFACGADVITGGNHTLRRREVHNMLDENSAMLRPHNMKTEYGSGYTVIDFGYTRVAIINLSGTVYLESANADNPFTTADVLIERAKNDGINIIIVDFHAEATSEKRALGFYLDGRCSAVFGTHTHVQTADAQILENGTGYITDIGMTGPADSVLGVKKEIIIDRLKNNGHEKFELESGRCILTGCIFEIDNKTGKTVSVKPVCIQEEGI